jgi:putative heme-binding domain-containing protein
MFPASKPCHARLTIPCAWLILTATVSANDNSPGKPVHAADGLAVRCVAAPPLVQFPMFATFDDAGRLYVAESSGLDLYAELKAQTRKCRVTRLTDRDGDGRFDETQVFADKLVFPMGLAWRNGTLYVADPPHLVALRDTNGDGRADERKKILGDFGHIDNGSLHGLVFGPDGWLYLTMGSPDGFRIERPGREPLAGTSGALFRCRPDGSHPQVLSRGFANLVEVDFSPTGVVIGTNNWHQQPTAGLRDSLLHLVPGGIYPYVSPYGTPLFVATGESLPALALYPAVAGSGVTRLRTSALGRDYENCFVTAQFNARRVMRHRLESVGSTYRAVDAPILSSSDPHFRPSDVIEDADGSLLVIDTGGWYVQHCPTNRIGEAQVPGGIYRVQRRDANRVADPWGLAIDFSKLSVEQLIDHLSDHRVAVQEKATQALCSHGQAACAALTRLAMNEQAPQHARLHAIWALSRLETDESLSSLRGALRSHCLPVAETAARALSIGGNSAAEGELSACLAGDRPLSFRLAAAETLSNCATPKSKSALVTALAAPDIDRHLEHCLVLALHRAAALNDLRNLLGHGSPRVQKAALWLLDQPPHERLAADEVHNRVGSADEDLRRTALALLARHPEWAGRSITLIRKRVMAPELSLADAQALDSLLTAFERNSEIQALVADAIRGGHPPARREQLLAWMATSRLAKLPEKWIEALTAAVSDSNPNLVRRAVHTISILRLAQFDGKLLEIARNEQVARDTRIDALRGALLGHPKLVESCFKLLTDELTAEVAGVRRLAAAEIIGKARLSKPQALWLLANVADDPLVWPLLLPACGRLSDREVGIALATRVQRLLAQGAVQLSQEQLQALVAKFPDDVRRLFEPSFAQIRRQSESIKLQVERYRELLSGGDPSRGRALFAGSQVACSACHRVSGEGGIVGPDLSKIGTVRSGHDLVESLVAPSATFAQGYQSFDVLSTDGRTATGVLAGGGSDQDAVAVRGGILVLRDSAGKETRFAADQIDELGRSSVSIMPQGLLAKLSDDQIRDLLAYLQSLR